MIRRREILAGGLAGVLMLAAGTPAAALARASGGRGVAMFDPRLSSGKIFAQMASRLSLPSIDLAPDSATMLYGSEVKALLAGRPVLLGMTSYADYLVTAGIMREQGRAVAGAVMITADRVSPIAGDIAELTRLADEAGCSALLAPRSGTTSTSVFWAIDRA